MHTHPTRTILSVQHVTHVTLPPTDERTAYTTHRWPEQSEKNKYVTCTIQNSRKKFIIIVIIMYFHFFTRHTHKSRTITIESLCGPLDFWSHRRQCARSCSLRRTLPPLASYRFHWYHYNHTHTYILTNTINNFFFSENSRALLLLFIDVVMSLYCGFEPVFMVSGWKL